MSQPELIGSPQSIFVRTVRLALHEKGVRYQLTPAAPHSPRIRAIHPFGYIPVFKHAECTLFESRAITFYIDETFDGRSLTPADVYGRALVEQWISLLNTSILPAFVAFTKSVYFPEAAPAHSVELLPGVVRGLDLLDEAVSSTPYLVGSQFSLADMSVLPILAYLEAIPASQSKLEDHHGLSCYFGLHRKRESWAATEPPPMSEIGANDAS